MKANRILAAGWGVLYILIAIWSAFLLTAGYTALMQILNNTATVLMGIFTGWFENGIRSVSRRENNSIPLFTKMFCAKYNNLNKTKEPYK